MTLSTANKLMTAEELLELGPDFHGELVQGRLKEMAPAGWKHGQFGEQASFILGNFVRQHSLGVVVTAETGFVLSRNPDTVRAPDWAFISAARIATANETGFFDGAPDFAIEILSPKNSAAEIADKTADYLKAGCKLVWIISPKDRTITVHQPNQSPLVGREGDTIDGGQALPGFSSPVSAFMV